MMGMSAVKATVENIEAAPAAIRHFTLRIGFVLLAREASAKDLTRKFTDEPSH
jgi:hypothetical protein